MVKEKLSIAEFAYLLDTFFLAPYLGCWPMLLGQKKEEHIQSITKRLHERNVFGIDEKIIFVYVEILSFGAMLSGVKAKDSGVYPLHTARILQKMGRHEAFVENINEQIAEIAAESFRIKVKTGLYYGMKDKEMFKYVAQHSEQIRNLFGLGMGEEMDLISTLFNEYVFPS